MSEIISNTKRSRKPVMPTAGGAKQDSGPVRGFGIERR